MHCISKNFFLINQLYRYTSNNKIIINFIEVLRCITDNTSFINPSLFFSHAIKNKNTENKNEVKRVALLFHFLSTAHVERD